MSKRKRVRVTCHSPFAVYPEAEEPWTDVWLAWKERPGRACRRAGPTLCGRSNLEWDMEATASCIEKHGPEGFDEDRDYERRILAAIEADGIATLDTENCPNIYTSRPYIDRAEAERMLAWWLARSHGIHNPRFDWRRPSVFVQSVGG